MIFWILYIILGAGHLLTGYMDFPALSIPMKIALLPTLMLAFRYSFKGPLSGIAKAILVAQLFSWFGDVLLIRAAEPAFFLSGLVAFLIGHLAYIVAFRKEIISKPRVCVMVNDPWMALPFAAIGVGMLWWMWDGLGDMRWPVTAYTTCIISMLAVSFNRLRLVSNGSFWLVFIGAALFVLSDSMIAVNRFIAEFEGARGAIMSTYITAQFMIALGMAQSLGGKIKL